MFFLLFVNTASNNRYYLYFEGSTLLAMTGLMYSKEYRNFEVDWTCTHPDYRHKGYMQELFKEMLKDIDVPVYCSCWRAPDKDRVNLHTIMFLFGFEEVIHSRVHWKVHHNCFLIQDGCSCTHYTDADCNCYEDLFLRKGLNYEN